MELANSFFLTWCLFSTDTLNKGKYVTSIERNNENFIYLKKIKHAYEIYLISYVK